MSFEFFVLTVSLVNVVLSNVLIKVNKSILFKLHFFYTIMIKVSSASVSSIPLLPVVGVPRYDICSRTSPFASLAFMVLFVLTAVIVTSSGLGCWFMLSSIISCISSFIVIDGFTSIFKKRVIKKIKCVVLLINKKNSKKRESFLFDVDFG